MGGREGEEGEGGEEIREEVGREGEGRGLEGEGGAGIEGGEIGGTRREDKKEKSGRSWAGKGPKEFQDEPGSPKGGKRKERLIGKRAIVLARYVGH